MGSNQPESDVKMDLDDSGCVQDDVPPLKPVDKDNGYVGQAGLLDLSDDVLLYILRYCSPHDLKALGYSCPRLGALVLERSLWARVDARSVCYGRGRARWLLRHALHAGTRELKFTGLARLALGCQGHVNRTRPEAFEERKHGRGDGPGEDSLSEPETEEPAHRRPCTLFRHDMHLPRISSSPCWPESDSEDSDAEPDTGEKCEGPMFTMGRHMLKRLRVQCPKLTSLYLEYCNIDCNKMALCYLPPTLKRLSLKGTRCYNLPLDKSYLFKIQDYLPELEYLVLSECTWLEPASLLPLSKLPRLLRLFMCNCPCMQEFVAYVSLATRYGFRKLQVLDLRESPVGDSEVSALGWLPELRELYLAAPEPEPPSPPPHHHYIGDRRRRLADTEMWETEIPEYYQDSTGREQDVCVPEDALSSIREREISMQDEVVFALQQRGERGIVIQENLDGNRQSLVQERIANALEQGGYVRNPDNMDRNRESMIRERIALALEEGGFGINRDRFDRNPDRLDRNPDSLDRNRDRLGRNPDSLDRNRDRLGRNPDSLDRNRDRLGRNRDRLGRNRDSLDRNRDRFGRNRDSLDRNPDSLDRNPDSLDRNQESNPDTNEEPGETSVKNTTNSLNLAEDLERDENGERKRKTETGGTDQEAGPSKRAKDVDINETIANIQNSQVTVTKKSGVVCFRRTIFNNVTDINERLNVNHETDNKKDKEKNDGSPTPKKDGESTPKKDGEPSPKKDGDQSPKKDGEPSSKKRGEPSPKKDGGPKNKVRRTIFNNLTDFNERLNVNAEADNKKVKKEQEKTDGEPTPKKNGEPSSKKDGESSSKKDDEPNPKEDEEPSSKKDGDPTPRKDSNKLEEDLNLITNAVIMEMGESEVEGDIEVRIFDSRYGASTSNGPTYGGNTEDKSKDKSEDKSKVSSVDIEKMDADNEPPAKKKRLENNDKYQEKIEKMSTESEDSSNDGSDMEVFDDELKKDLKESDGSTLGQSSQEKSDVNNSSEVENSNTGQSTASSSQSSTKQLSPSVQSRINRLRRSVGLESDPNQVGSASNQRIPPPSMEGPSRPQEYVRFRRNQDPIVIEYRAQQEEQAQPRHHVLYVNLGQQLHAVYRLLPSRAMPHNRSRSLSAERLDSSSLVTDIAIRRFGRADGDNVNIVNIGPQFIGRDTSSRPNRSNLRVLYATGYRNITNRSLMHLATASPYLEVVDFTETGVTESGIEQFRSLRPDVQITWSPYQAKDEE